MNVKYEYKILPVQWYPDAEAIEAMLNKYGAAGWQPTEFRWGSGEHVHVVLYRPVREAQPQPLPADTSNDTI